jgi:hypothetical protein
MNSRRLLIRIVLLVVLMAAVIVVGAFPNALPTSVRALFQEDGPTSPKATACRDEAIRKFPNDMQEIGRTPDGTGKTMINRNAKAYGDAYAECMKR